MNPFLDRYLYPFLRKARTRLGGLIINRHVKSYSQEGEDMILRRIFENTKEGFYVDVGAYHPMLYSNTYYFYKRGWRGINIEPNPEYMKLFHKYRGRDINLPIGVSDVKTELAYYMFNEPALNTTEKEIANRPTRNEKRYYPTGETVIQVDRLDAILQEHLPKKRKMDFLSVDVEGHELKVVRSNDWERFRPRCLLVESLDCDMRDVLRSDLHRYMGEVDYALYGKTVNTLFYLDID